MIPNLEVPKISKRGRRKVILLREKEKGSSL
jgi:hypothetical protein